MAELLHLDANGRRIAYRQTVGADQAKGPGVIFLGGFRSDMTGTKAQALEGWAQRSGHAFVRFDYSGHGQSSGAFTDGCIGDWANDALAVLRELTGGPQVLVGSSMGGWIALLLAKHLPARVAGLVTIAAAPDFTEDSLWAGFSDTDRDRLMTQGRVDVPSDYDDGPYVITRALIEDGREHLVLRSPLDLPFPVRLLQGTADTAVDMSVALRLFGHVAGPDIRLTVVKGADHRFSTPACLTLIEAEVADVLSCAG